MRCFVRSFRGRHFGGFVTLELFAASILSQSYNNSKVVLPMVNNWIVNIWIAKRCDYHLATTLNLSDHLVVEKQLIGFDHKLQFFYSRFNIDLNQH